MAIDIDEIKRLPNAEKLELINELWESIEKEWEPESGEESPEILALLDERIKKVEKSNSKFYTGEEVRNRLEKKLEEVRKAKDERNNLYS